MKKHLFIIPLIVSMFLGGYGLASAGSCCMKASCVCAKGGCCVNGECTCQGGCCTKDSCQCAEGKCDAGCTCQKQ